METTILVADDHRLVRAGVRRILENRGDFCVVAEASNGEEAVELTRKKRPHVVLLDLSMPRLSGIEVIRRLAQAGSAAKVLVLSMHEDPSCVEEVLRAGAAGYVVKDAAPNELLCAIDAVRRGDSYLSPSITHQMLNTNVRPGWHRSASNTLTTREREVLRLIVDGLSSKEIAEQLGISLKTVESHRSNLMEKLGTHKMSSLVRCAIRSGLVAL